MGSLCTVMEQMWIHIMGTRYVRQFFFSWFLSAVLIESRVLTWISTFKMSPEMDQNDIDCLGFKSSFKNMLHPFAVWSYSTGCILMYGCFLEWILCSILWEKITGRIGTVCRSRPLRMIFFPMTNYAEFCLKGVLHPRPVFGLFLHFCQKLQYFGDR